MFCARVSPPDDSLIYRSLAQRQELIGGMGFIFWNSAELSVRSLWMISAVLPVRYYNFTIKL